MIRPFYEFICWLSGGHIWIQDFHGIEFCKDCGKLKPPPTPQPAQDSQS